MFGNNKYAVRLVNGTGTMKLNRKNLRVVFTETADDAFVKAVQRTSHRSRIAGRRVNSRGVIENIISE